jgi:hypothetical protein
LILNISPKNRDGNTAAGSDEIRAAPQNVFPGTFPNIEYRLGMAGRKVRMGSPSLRKGIHTPILLAGMLNGKPFN